MKHTAKITILLLAMFFITQMIGLYVLNAYTSATLPYGMQPPEMKPEVSIWSIIISIFLAISFVFILMRIRAVWVIRIWFFSVIALALAITFNAFFHNVISYSTVLSLSLGLFLSYIKIFKRHILVHNLTELLIYPGIAAIFVPLLGITSAFILLILISAYDIYAVWYAKFMQQMAKFQIKEMKFFAGFFVPYIRGKQVRSVNFSKRNRGRKIKVSLAILGGGDVIFPILAAGVVFKAWGLLPALAVSIFATLGLFLLFVNAKKGRFYPAMPFITAGCFIGLLFAYLIKLFVL